MLIAIVLPLLAALIAPPCFDRVLLKDGREIEGTILPSTDPAFVRLKLAGAEIPIRADLVAKTFVENLEGYAPKNKQEEDNLKKGWVLFQGQWMSKDRREAELKKKADADKAAIAETKKRQQWKNAVVKDSTHFSVKSNCDDAVVADYINRLEEFYKYFCADWNVSLTPGQTKGKMQVALHRSKLDNLVIGQAGNKITATITDDGGDISVTWDADNPRAAMRELYFSAFAQLTFYINPKFLYPAWLRSGMSWYYSTLEVDDKGRFKLGDLAQDYVYQLQEAKKDGKIPPLKQVVLPEDSDDNPIRRAVRWSFVHFLMQSPKYGKPLKAFYATLSKNQDAGVHAENTQTATIDVADDAKLITAMEKRLGAPLAQLEKEWLATIDYPDAKMSAQDCFEAATSALSRARDEKDDASIELAFLLFDKADTLGLKTSYFYRRYAELLRLGGVREQGNTHQPHKPDQLKAWAMIQKAIDLDPIDPYNYTEAAGVLVLNGPAQDIDRAAALADTAMAIAGPRNIGIKSLHDELIALIEPAREKKRAGAEAAAAEAANDRRVWTVAFDYVAGTPEPPQIQNLKTSEVRELIHAGKVGPEAKLFQSWRDNDPDTGAQKPSDNPWDNGWIKVKDIPIFADDLKIAAAATGGAGGAGSAAPTGTGTGTGTPSTPPSGGAGGKAGGG